MIPQPGQKVKIIFRNGLVEEGFVIKWTGEKTILRSLVSENVLIIQRTDEDVMAYQICFDNKRPLQSRQVYVEDEPIKEPVRDLKLHALKLSELKALKSKEEKARARQLLTSFEADGSNQVEYGIPRRIQKPPNFGIKK